MFSQKQLERMMQIAQALKEFSYDKHTGTWAWFDHDERDNIEAHHVGFESFYDALINAVDPYLNLFEEN